MQRCSRFQAISLAALLVPMVFAAPAMASHETIMVDGNLADLITAVNNNLGESNGGFTAASPLGNIYSPSCSFVNGFDIRNVYAFFDFKEEGGAISNSVDLYLGWEVEGVIGDVDGDNNPDTFTMFNAMCANNGDQAGIGSAEAYNFFGDAGCDFTPDLQIFVSNNAITVNGGAAAGATFSRNGSFLEVHIPNLQNYSGADLCGLRFFMTANATFDGLGEDASPQFIFAVPPSVSVTKTPPTQEVCVGTNADWTITVTNDGLCVLDVVNVADTLDAGLSFVSSNPAPDGGADQIRTYVINDLEPGESEVITLVATLDGPCNGELANRVGVEALSDNDCRTEPATASDWASATVSCLVPDVDIEKTLDVSSVGLDGIVTVTLTIENTGNTDLDPVQVCDLIDAGVTFDELQVIGGTCGVTLDGVDGNEICFTEFSLDEGDQCTIIYQIACGEAGTHADTAEVTAYCAGTETNPVTDEDIASFTCQDGGFACPHTIGFWRQQCAQRGNGSTKVCLAGMQNLWRCVITETDVIQWKNNDGSFTTTAAYAALSDANLFTALCSQLEGPRPMTNLDMAEIQYLGLMLNVCSGALPLDTPIQNGFDGTVGAAIDSIEAAINSGVNVNFWKNVADDINNRIGVLAEDCPGGDSLFRNVEGCVIPDASSDLGSAASGSIVGFDLRANPNPVAGQGVSISFRIPAEMSGSKVEVQVFDLTGRLVKTLASDTRAAGSHSIEWDLTDASGSSVSSGIFFSRVTIGDEHVTQKIMVMRR